MNKSKYKFNKTRIIRGLIQLAAFLLMPGLFISTFSAIKDIYVALIAGTFSLGALSYQLLLLLAVFPVTILLGRFFCGYLCSFGAMGDLLWFISKKIHKKRILISPHADRILKMLKYFVLIFIVVLIWTFGIVSFNSTTDPWTIFGMFASLGNWPVASYLLTVGGGLLLLIIVGSLFVERFFCRYLCPLGAVFSIISLPRVLRIKKPRSNCGACTLCTKKCSMGIPLNQTDRVASGECINCFQCVSVCPRQNAKANPAPAVATAMAVVAMTGMYYVGSLTATTASASTAAATSSAVTQSDTTTTTSGSYIDGTYTGSGTGFRGTTNVSVTVSNGYITAIDVVSYQDDQQYFVRAENSLISSIISNQSVDVSTVSGATFSSNGILEAVADALSLDFTNTNSSQSNDRMAPGQ